MTHWNLCFDDDFVCMFSLKIPKALKIQTNYYKKKKKINITVNKIVISKFYFNSV